MFENAYSSEVVTAQNSSKRRRVSPQIRLAAAVAATLGMIAPSVFGQGQVERISHGSARVQSNGANTVINAADRTVINYRRFDVPSGSAVQFVQPSAAARVLNRINSATPSKIDGSIT